MPYVIARIKLPHDGPSIASTRDSDFSVCIIIQLYDILRIILIYVCLFSPADNVIKKILKHLGLWDVKRQPRPTDNAPPINVFPPYDEQAPSVEDYI